MHGKWDGTRLSGSNVLVAKTLLTGIKSPSEGACACCGEPVYDPAHDLACRIFEALPAIDGIDAQATYEKIVEHIEEAFGELLVICDDLDGEVIIDSPETVN
jgi:hypothetical protein